MEMVTHRYKINCIPGFNGDDLRAAFREVNENQEMEARLEGLTEIVVEAPKEVEVDELVSWTLHHLILRKLPPQEGT